MGINNLKNKMEPRRFSWQSGGDRLAAAAPKAPAGSEKLNAPTSLPRRGGGSLPARRDGTPQPRSPARPSPAAAAPPAAPAPAGRRPPLPARPAAARSHPLGAGGQGGRQGGGRAGSPLSAGAAEKRRKKAPALPSRGEEEKKNHPNPPNPTLRRAAAPRPTCCVPRSRWAAGVVAFGEAGGPGEAVIGAGWYKA